MKIGILTFVNTINYGALFQAYALSVTLRQMGHDTQIIQYKNKVIERREHGTNCFSIRGILNLLVIGNGFKRKEKKFRAFNALYLKSTSECDTTTIADVCRGFDKIITGSDQVWNLSLTGYDLHYFLDFVTVPEKQQYQTKQHSTQYLHTRTYQHACTVHASHEIHSISSFEQRIVIE